MVATPLGGGETRRRWLARRRDVPGAGEPPAQTTIVTSSASYVPVGLAHCFLKNEEGRLEDALRVEPINSSSLECMHVGAPTSFKAVTALTLGELHDLTIADLPEEFAGAELCEDFAARGEAAARTWTRTHAQEALMDIVPLGALKTDFNFCPEDRPRVVNAIRVVTVRAVSAGAPAAEVAPQRPAPPASPHPRA